MYTPRKNHASIINGTEKKERFAVMEDPSNPINYGIKWESGEVEGGFTHPMTAKIFAIAQNGTEADASESQAWER